MRYLNDDDLTVCIQERLLKESLQLDTLILDKIEEQAIDLAISCIGGRYDTTKIFATPSIRNGVLVQALSMIVVYRVVRRNAARKVPEDYIDMYDDAIKLLGKIQSGSLYLGELPAITAPDGSTGKLMYGNNKNKDFFI